MHMCVEHGSSFIPALVKPDRNQNHMDFTRQIKSDIGTGCMAYLKQEWWGYLLFGHLGKNHANQWFQP